jgi:deoxyribodipyrimidine photo-lyase
MAQKQLVWLRNDLRLDDNPALHQAALAGEVEVVFCATPTQWKAHDRAPAQLGLMADALNHLSARLGALGIKFSVLELDEFADCAEALKRYCSEHNISQLWFNHETPLDERRRDQQVTEAMQSIGVAVNAMDYDLIVPSPVLNLQGTPFKVFTPYYRRWLLLLQDQSHQPFAVPESQGAVVTNPQYQFNWAGDYRDDLWPAEEEQVLNRLTEFCERKLDLYKAKRDFPALPATSTLSPYLSLGMVGPRRCLTEIQFHCAQTGREWRDDDWLRELAWRDFYKQLLLHFKAINMNKAFKPETEAVVWRDDPTGFTAWCNGQTGFPIVDAAMRQLNQTGWMHNRLRMIAASFLTKLLLLDWRQGEQYFMEKLIDGDFASNNGGWQWSASTGCDSAPYFRVFNPMRQSERFDPEGEFIRRFVPELAEVSNKEIHDPKPETRAKTGYPNPVVDYKPARVRAIEAFEAIR